MEISRWDEEFLNSLKYSCLHNYDAAGYVDIVVAEEAGVSTISRHLIQSKPFAFISVSGDDFSLQDEIRKLDNVLVSLFKADLSFIYLRGFFELADERIVGNDFACFVPMPDSLTEQSFRERISYLLEQFDLGTLVYSDGTNWGLIKIGGKLVPIGDALEFNSQSIVSAWDLLSGRKHCLVESGFCAAGIWSKVGRRSQGVLCGIHGDRWAVADKLGQKFQKAPVGSRLILDDKIYECVSHRMWSDGGEPFLPKGEMFHFMASAYGFWRVDSLFLV